MLALKTENKQRPRAAASCLPDRAGAWPSHTYRSAAACRPWSPVHAAALLCTLFPPEERSVPLAFKTPARVLIGGPAHVRPRRSSDFLLFIAGLGAEETSPRGVKHRRRGTGTRKLTGAKADPRTRRCRPAAIGRSYS